MKKLLKITGTAFAALMLQQANIANAGPGDEDCAGDYNVVAPGAINTLINADSTVQNYYDHVRNVIVAIEPLSADTTHAAYPAIAAHDAIPAVSAVEAVDAEPATYNASGLELTPYIPAVPGVNAAPAVPKVYAAPGLTAPYTYTMNGNYARLQTSLTNLRSEIDKTYGNDSTTGTFAGDTSTASVHGSTTFSDVATYRDAFLQHIDLGGLFDPSYTTDLTTPKIVADLYMNTKIVTNPKTLIPLAAMNTQPQLLNAVVVDKLLGDNYSSFIDYFSGRISTIKTMVPTIYKDILASYLISDKCYAGAQSIQAAVTATLATQKGLTSNNALSPNTEAHMDTVVSGVNVADAIMGGANSFRYAKTYSGE